MIRRSWRLARVALQLIAEERVGAPMREEAAARRAEQDAGFEALKARISGPS